MPALLIGAETEAIEADAQLFLGELSDAAGARLPFALFETPVRVRASAEFDEARFARATAPAAAP